MSGISRFKTIYSEGVAKDHSDLEGQPEFANKADEILAKRKQNRKNARLDAIGRKLYNMNKIGEEFELGEETLQDKKEREERIAARRARVRELTQAGRTMTSSRRTSEQAKERREQNKTETIEKRGEDILRQILGHSGKVSDAPMGSTQVPEKQEAPEANRRLHPKLRRDTLGSAADRALKNEAAELGERHMTSAERRKEEALGKKTGSAKEAMMKEYGAEKGEQIYYAWKRKKAMSEEADDNGFTKCWPGKKKKGFKMKNGKKVNNCVPEELDYSDAYEFVIETLINADFAQDYETAENMFECMSEEFVSTILEEYIEEKARGTRPKRTVHAYDVDETLFSHGKKGKPNVQVHVKDASGKRVKSLSNQEFNTHKLEKGHEYDFGEFRSAKTFSKTSTPNKKIIADLKRRQARGQNVHLITARSKFDKPSEFKRHLEKHGIKTPMSNIHYTGGMKGGDIGKKKVDVASAVAKKSGTKSMHMHDDAAKVHKAFEAEKQNKPTSTKIKTHMIKPNKSGEPTSRSYQATKEDFELWVNALIDEGYDLSEFTIDELYEGYEEFLDEASNIVATAAPEPEPHRPEKKGPRKLNPIYKGIKKSAPKKEYKENFTPYEFWMNIIETQQPEATEEVVEEKIEEIVEEGPTTSYDYWKNYIEENANFGNN